MKIIALNVLFLGLLSPGPPLETMSGKVIEVIDGNTLRLLSSENSTYEISLYAVDCPESLQAYGAEAKQFLEGKLKGKMVDVEVEARDRWGVRQAIVIPKEGEDPRIQLVAEGLAWTAETAGVIPGKSSKQDQELAALEREAQARGKGLWTEKHPIAPWTFRRQQSMMVPKSR
jgi:endonuclease YncB( thermonuclease family)